MAAQHRLAIAAINKIVNTVLAGQSTGMVFEGEKRFELVVRISARQKKNVQYIRDQGKRSVKGAYSLLMSLNNKSEDQY
jgi:Cu/Ag efflux pump CusA